MAEFIRLMTIFLVGELLATLIFWGVVKSFKRKLTPSSVLRGALERLFLFVCLTNKLPQGLAFFGALKIATRLTNEDKISNDYFLTGNIISVLIVITEYLLVNEQITILN